MTRPLRFCAACGAALSSSATRRRVYCSERCRVAAYRRRRMAAQLQAELEAPAAAWIPQAPVEPMRFAHPDEQVATALLEAHRVAGALLRLGREARPVVAWRCEKIGAALRAALLEHFGEL